MEKHPFDDILARLKKGGWREACPSEHIWHFQKRNRWADLNWQTRTVSFWSNRMRDMLYQSRNYYRRNR